ncbi:hypothetical protein ABZT17_40915 [Streptomyces sp. NPDC005648]|uniref:hypothetical protein n=1 Tax=Streptomyces sp. NPDC005648 TaxID=3157044 RepID=UPI0033A000E5
MGRTVEYRTTVAAAFSTGINGLNQTLLHNLVDVSKLERLVIYDCLYAQSSGDTAAALTLAKSRAGLKLKIVVYECTTGGNSLTTGNELSVAVKNPGLIPSAGIVNLFYVPAYTALITFRSLEGGIADGVLTLSSGTPLESAFNAMKGITPARGAVVSSAATWRHVFGSGPPAGKVPFETWASDKTNLPVISGFLKFLRSKSKADTVRELIWGNQLPGWPGGDGEENHDLLLPDFGWEYLPGLTGDRVAASMQPLPTGYRNLTFVHRVRQGYFAHATPPRSTAVCARGTVSTSAVLLGLSATESQIFA